MTVIRRGTRDSVEDILWCTDCATARRVPRRQTVVLTQIHRCDDDPAWFIPEYVRPMVNRWRRPTIPKEAHA